MSTPTPSTTATQVTISKAVGPLLVSALLALYSYFTGAGELSAVVTPVVGIATFGVVYLVRYASTRYNKTIAAFVVPIVSAALLAWQTNDWGRPEFVLAVQAALGAAATYFLKYQEGVPGVAPTDVGD